MVSSSPHHISSEQRHNHNTRRAGDDSDGTVVIDIRRGARAPTHLEVFRYHIPGFLIAIWIGAFAGAALVAFVRHCLSR